MREVEEGGEVIVTRSGTPVARIIRAQPTAAPTTSYGLFRGQFKLGDDFDAESDELADLFGVPR